MRGRAVELDEQHPLGLSDVDSVQGLHPAREAAGRKDLRWHDLRHTGAVLAAQTGATLVELMGRLGHSTPGRPCATSTPAPTGDAEIVRRLSALVSAVGGSDENAS